LYVHVVIGFPEAFVASIQRPSANGLSLGWKAFVAVANIQKHFIRQGLVQSVAQDVRLPAEEESDVCALYRFCPCLSLRLGARAVLVARGHSN
jgi:hypothetical protein